MKTNFNIKQLFESEGIGIHPGIVELYDRMEAPETNPYDEWIKLALVAMKDLKQEGFSPKTVADIGTGNGIIAIGLTKIFKPETIYLTDIVEEVLGPSKQNLQRNITPSNGYLPEVISLAGRDAEPLPVNLIDFFVFNPPPLMSKDQDILNQGLARTTLTDYDFYSKYAQGPNDLLLKWSVLPWYAFLEGAKQKMKNDSVILGIYSGRIPFAAIEEAYARAGLHLKVPVSIIKRQQNPTYIGNYAEYEAKNLSGETFDFYNYGRARELMQQEGLSMPGLVRISDAQIKGLLEPAKLSAKEAFDQSQKGLPVAHIGHALVGRLC